MWLKFYNKLIFFAPVITVIAIATILVYFTYQANFIITAAVVSEEGTGSEAASAGFINALMFILPAIIGGFLIALLFKYRKKVTLKFFFGGALFFAGSFITFFFGDSLLYLIRTQFYELFILDFDPYNIEIFDPQQFIWLDGIEIIMIFCCGIISFWMAYSIISRKFTKTIKNYSLLLISGLMGAFLSVILPTYTVVILLIGLSIYDIYSVRRGPIKDIVKYSLEDEEKLYNNIYDESNLGSEKQIRIGVLPSPISLSSRINDNTTPNDNDKPNLKIADNDSSQNSTNKDDNINVNKNDPNIQNKIVVTQDLNKQQALDDTDFMLSSMTYSAEEWDVGIGDLVFYSLLASQPLTPYFISNHGAALMNTFGLGIFWLISLFTIIGILIGFVITIYLLERNSMLPGLPCSIALGLTGFLGSTLILSLL